MTKTTRQPASKSRLSRARSFASCPGSAVPLSVVLDGHLELRIGEVDPGDEPVLVEHPILRHAAPAGPPDASAAAAGSPAGTRASPSASADDLAGTLAPAAPRKRGRPPPARRRATTIPAFTRRSRSTTPSSTPSLPDEVQRGPHPTRPAQPLRSVTTSPSRRAVRTVTPGPGCHLRRGREDHLHRVGLGRECGHRPTERPT